MHLPRRSHILIVDDEPTQCLLACRALSLDGHDCITAHSADAARAVLSERSDLDLVISDINMPGESGLGLVAWLTEARPEVAVLMATAVDDRCVADQAITMGVHGYLIKPFELNELRIAVANALRRLNLERLQQTRSIELERLVARRTEQLDETAQNLRDREGRLASLVSAAPVGVLYADLDGRCEYANEAAARMSGYEPDHLLGDGFLRVLHPGDIRMVLDHLQRARWGRQHTSLEHRVIRADGNPMVVHTEVAPVLDDHGQAMAFIAVVQDVTEQRRFEQELSHQATHDDLTGLPNRHLLLDRIERMLDGGIGTVMLIDLDRFKFVNDVHGHTMGDRLLVEAARVLSAEFAAGETVARFGGDEFVVVSPGTDETDVPVIAHRALAAIGDLELADRRVSGASASIGISSASSGSTPDDLLRGADMAMYRVKDRGGGGYEVFDEDLGEVVKARVRLEEELRAAIERSEFEVHYQPQVDCSDGRLWGVEALVRWRHPARGLLPASAFLPAATEAGLMELVTEFVLDRASAQSLAWSSQTPDGEPVRLAVNVSAPELESGLLRGRVADVIDRRGLDPTRMTLEVTEGSLINDLARSAVRLDALRELGVRTSLDDFGTGYSSLSYLSRLPLDELKIDRVFVQRLRHCRPGPDGPLPDRQLVEAIIQLAAIFDLDVVAEGIEHSDELELLRDMGCTVAQGFLTGRPMCGSDPHLVAMIRGLCFDLPRREPVGELTRSGRALVPPA